MADAKNDAPEANGKLKRKGYEQELARLHVELEGDREASSPMSVHARAAAV
jgi:hypothetical protein